MKEVAFKKLPVLNKCRLRLTQLLLCCLARPETGRICVLDCNADFLADPDRKTQLLQQVSQPQIDPSPATSGKAIVLHIVNLLGMHFTSGQALCADSPVMADGNLR